MSDVLLYIIAYVKHFQNHNPNSFISPVNWDICVSQQPKDSSI